MIHAKFQAPELSGSEEEDFWTFFLYNSLIQTKDPLGIGLF